jgi:hypothetical protein
MGEALRGGGVDLSSYRGTKCWFHRPGHTLKAEKLARWLERRTGQFGRVKRLSNVTDQDFIGKRGMVLCMSFWGTGWQGDHIDLWDGRWLAHGSDDYFGRSQSPHARAGAFLPHAWTLDDSTLDTVLLTSALTHDDHSSNAACVAFAQILAECLWGRQSITPGFFWETFTAAAAPIEGPVQLSSRIPGDRFRGSVCDLVAQRVPAALRVGISAQAACDSWYSGAYLLETVPSALFILERYRDDPEEALVRAVMDTWDNDTVAAIVGAVMGVLHGVDAFPQRWRDGLTGRTDAHDDGRVWAALKGLRRFGGRPDCGLGRPKAESTCASTWTVFHPRLGSRRGDA